MKIEMQLKDARVQAGLTQEQVAEKVMVSRQTISNWENGKSLPDIVSIMKLSDLYQISIDELLKGDQRMKMKIEKDANKAKEVERVLIATAVITVVFGLIYAISIFTGGAFREFCEGAKLWVMMAIGMACAVTLLSIHNRDAAFPEQDKTVPFRERYRQPGLESSQGFHVNRTWTVPHELGSMPCDSVHQPTAEKI